MTFTRPLVVSFSHPHTAQAVRDVRALVRPAGGHITVVGVVPTPHALQRLLTPRETEERVEHELESALRRDLEEWVSRATRTAHPDDVTIEVLHGHPVAAVLDRLLEHDHDLLAVTGHPDDTATRAIITRLQRKSPCPVWAIRPSRARTRRVLAAVDVDDTHLGLNHRLVDAAIWLAGEGGEVHVGTAWELLGEATLRTSPFISEDEAQIDELKAACEADHRQRLCELLAEHELDGHKVTCHVRHGPPAAVVTDLVERHRINQLVVGTLGRTGIPGFVMGNTAEELLADVTCSVFVVKPPGFTSPFHA